MGLIDHGDREKIGYGAVYPSHFIGVFVVECTFVLVQHNAIGSQGVEAIAVKLPRKQTFSWSKGVGGINNDQLVAIFALADEFDAVLYPEVYP